MNYVIPAILSVVSGVLVWIVKNLITENNKLRNEKEKKDHEKSEALCNGVLQLLERFVFRSVIEKTPSPIRWATVLFCAAAEMNRRSEDPYDVQIIGNWCCNVKPPQGYNDLNGLIAANQLRTLLAGK